MGGQISISLDGRANGDDRVRVVGILVSRQNINFGSGYSLEAANSEQFNYISEFAALEVGNFAAGWLDFLVSASQFTASAT